MKKKEIHPSLLWWTSLDFVDRAKFSKRYLNSKPFLDVTNKEVKNMYYKEYERSQEIAETSLI